MLYGLYKFSWLCFIYDVCIYFVVILCFMFFFTVYSVYEILVVQYNRLLNSGLLNLHFGCSFSQVLFWFSLFGLRHVPVWNAVCSYIKLEIIVSSHVNWEYSLTYKILQTAKNCIVPVCRNLPVAQTVVLQTGFYISRWDSCKLL